MALLNPAVVEGIRFVARQTAGVTLSTTVAAISPSVTQAPTTTMAPSPADTATTANGPNSGNVGNGNQGNNGGSGNGNSSSSSPLLFFVALGFGVVFTNLWIIVGVKYCFRYNARNRQMRLTEDGEPINMENLPRPHRRRREKKLMTMDEVNEKFPMMKYKTWVASRAEEGLPTRGGVTAPPSRANSIRDADGVAPELPSKERMSVEERPMTSTTAAAKPETPSPHHVPKESTSSMAAEAAPRTSTDDKLVPIVSETATMSKEANRVSHDEEEDDDEHINAALPPECMGTSGDTCAICIDTLEDDDDVRGLTCGHAFHAACLDPWLTSRRACCPLCKADYYTPKPRPPAAEPGDASGGVITVSLADPRGNRINMPSRPRHTFLGFRRPGRINQDSQSENRTQGDSYTRSRQRIVAPATTSSPTSNSSSGQPANAGVLSSLRTRYHAVWGSRQQNNHQNQTEGPAASGTNDTVTPSNLEAGVRSPAS
ncbi:hypothetical protein B0H63DRAFT_20350 [Podospora didyma]|uniref:RING-type domain-containing protein n=1 Tax=Podospora didyma TaxID=330526 RepID=A0AAE0P5D9_9PEZI|nr:hypothetical protein B0H63DRAFT_20350 [Podospora didyma]